jgi:hypothetical protein
MASEPRALAVTPRLLILAAAPKWLAADKAQAVVLRSLLQLAIHVPELALGSVAESVARLVVAFSESAAQAAEPRSLAAILVQATTAVLLDLAAALKPLAVLLLLFAVPLSLMDSRV